MTLDKEETKNHYYDKPVVSREHLTVITEPFEKEKEVARLEKKNRTRKIFERTSRRNTKN